MTIQVSRVRANDGVVIVSFQDGHQATFVENFGGWGQPTTLERIWLEAGRQTVAMFHSGRQNPINYRPFGFVKLASGYTVERVTEYWKAAHAHVAAAFREDRLTDAWRILCLGHQDIEELEAGRWPAP